MNIVFVFADQHRWCDTGYAGNPDVQTPHLDALAKESVNFRTAIATMPVCSPWRASFLTGQYPLTHGLFLNDLRLNNKATSLAQAFGAAGYDTAYIGKWHIDGTGRSAPIPPERRLGFAHWRVLECTHDYNHSEYFSSDDPEKHLWPGYDADAQTDEALRYLKSRSKDKPFLLVLSWGPPHDPYRTGPKDLLDFYDSKALTLRPNVPAARHAEIQKLYAGYYAHITALDRNLGRLRAALPPDTLLVYTSDHGDMLGSQNQLKKQRPWDESLRVPLLMRLPDGKPRTIDGPIGTPDLMPTLLGLCGLPIPKTVEGRDLSRVVRGKQHWADDDALFLCPSPFGEFTRERGGREYRGIRTQRHTYVQALSPLRSEERAEDGGGRKRGTSARGEAARGEAEPWLLFDNEKDPFQQNNLATSPAHAALREDLDARLQKRLKATGDDFASGPELIRRCGYRVDATGTVNYTDPASHGQVTIGQKQWHKVQ